MNIRLGIYELFSRIVPGVFYIAAIGQLLVSFRLITFDLKTFNDISISTTIVLITIAYVIGGALDRFSLVWFQLFEKKGLSARSLEKFKQKNKSRWVIDFEGADWPLQLAFIRTKNLDLAGEIERHNAISIMLRNVSLGLLLMMVNSIIQLVIYQNPILIVVSIFLLIISILVIRESIKFRRWFYKAIYDTIIAFRLDLEKIVKPAKKEIRKTVNELQNK